MNLDTNVLRNHKHPENEPKIGTISRLNFEDFLKINLLDHINYQTSTGQYNVHHISNDFNSA